MRVKELKELVYREIEQSASERQTATNDTDRSYLSGYQAALRMVEVKLNQLEK